LQHGNDPQLPDLTRFEPRSPTGNKKSLQSPAELGSTADLAMNTIFVDFAAKPSREGVYGNLTGWSCPSGFIHAEHGTTSLVPRYFHK
jgi:hypothetical protein